MKKKRRLKKKPVFILLLTMVVIIFLITMLNKPKKEIVREQPKLENDDEIKDEIGKKSPLEMSLSEFTLEGYFDSVLSLNEVDDEYMSNIIYAGDSVALYYTINKINRSAVWHQISINPYTAQTCKVWVNSVKEYDSFVSLFKEKQPEVVIMTMGTNGVSTMDKDYFIEQYEIFLKSLIEASPNMRLIVQSIPPVPIERDKEGKALNNQKINEYNYYIAEMCDKLGLEFLFSANSMKDTEGGCNEGFCTVDLHPSKLGNDALYEYAKKHLGK